MKRPVSLSEAQILPTSGAGMYLQRLDSGPRRVAWNDVWVQCKPPRALLTAPRPLPTEAAVEAKSRLGELCRPVACCYWIPGFLARGEAPARPICGQALTRPTVGRWVPAATWDRPVSGPRGAMRAGCPRILGPAGRNGRRGLRTSKLLGPSRTVCLTGRGCRRPDSGARSGASRISCPSPGPAGPSDSPARGMPPTLPPHPPRRRPRPLARPAGRPRPQPAAAAHLRRAPRSLPPPASSADCRSRPAGASARPGPGSAASRRSPPLPGSPRPRGRAGPPVPMPALPSTPLTLPPRCSPAPRHALGCARTAADAWAPEADGEPPWPPMMQSACRAWEAARLREQRLSQEGCLPSGQSRWTHRRPSHGSPCSKGMLWSHILDQSPIFWF